MLLPNKKANVVVGPNKKTNCQLHCAQKTKKAAKQNNSLFSGVHNFFQLGISTCNPFPPDLFFHVLLSSIQSHLFAMLLLKSCCRSVCMSRALCIFLCTHFFSRLSDKLCTFIVCILDNFFSSSGACFWWPPSYITFYNNNTTTKNK